MFLPLLMIAVLLSGAKSARAAGEHPASPLGAAPLEDFIQAFSRQGFVLKDSVRGDLNRDSLPDLILVFTNKSLPGSAPADTVEPRPLAGLLGAGGGRYVQAFVNFSAVLCRTCATGLKDPYSRTVIKKGFFFLEQAGYTASMELKAKLDWKRITTFRYDDSLKTWMLHKDGMVSREIPSGPKPKREPPGLNVIRTAKDFGR